MSTRLRTITALVASMTIPLAVASCARPEPPQLAAKQVSVTGVALAGINVELKIDAYNPNGFDISALRVVARTVVDGRYDLGSMTIPSGVTLAARQTTSMTVPAEVKWGDATQVATLALANRPVPFRIDGTATIGSDKLNVDVPFHFEGSITPDQLRLAATRSLPPLPVFAP